MTDEQTNLPDHGTDWLPAHQENPLRPRGVKHPRLWGVVGWSATVVILGMIATMALSIALWPAFLGMLPWHDTGRGKVEGINLVKLALSVVAGAGGAVALTVSVLKQRILERDEEGARARTQLTLAQRQAENDLEKTARDEERARQESYRSRYGEAATHLGSDRAAVQLAGVYAMANLADDWPEQRQQCVDVLCGFLRLPPPTDHALQASDAKVRTTIGAVLRDHLQKDGPWCNLDFNLTGAYLVNLNLDGAQFTVSRVK